MSRKGFGVKTIKISLLQIVKNKYYLGTIEWGGPKLKFKLIFRDVLSSLEMSGLMFDELLFIGEDFISARKIYKGTYEFLVENEFDVKEDLAKKS